MRRSSQEAAVSLSVWIVIIILALVAVLTSGLAALLPLLIKREASAGVDFVSAVFPTMVAVLVAFLALWASRLLMEEAKREAARDLELAQMRSDLALAQKAREQRHDLLNHLTVVSALIQTGSADQALAYLRRATYEQPEEAASGAPAAQIDPGFILGLMGQKLAQAARAGVALEIHVQNESDHLCIPDVVAARILGNLTDNAIDAAGEAGEGTGKVTVEMVLSAGRCRFRVRNNGSVITQQQLSRIFAAGESTKGGQHQGLGLHIVQQLVREYEGSLCVQSDASTGTEFDVRFEPGTRLAKNGSAHGGLHRPFHW
ncbi:sensor histidine kinase [Limnochorda pilosa]|uniref:Histidine kinase n=1 Tax=Limnochorda pilosa TaxID=1555112 RepID=A0A0K2SHJ1_LIMPI|nr:ATP-binding protein [Limnochorda pilosa]BAS26560.1 histidine kinase [Limnochorda pilosa]